MFFKNPMFNGYKFPDMTSCEGLERRFLGKVSKSGLAFMKGCLKIDPSERLTAEQCLSHKYFEGLPRDVIYSDCQAESVSPQREPETMSRHPVQPTNKANIVPPHHEVDNVNTQPRKKKAVAVKQQENIPQSNTEKPFDLSSTGLENDLSLFQGNKRGKSRQGARDDFEPPRALSRADKKKRKPIQIDVPEKLKQQQLVFMAPKPIQGKQKPPIFSTDKRTKPNTKLKQIQTVNDVYKVADENNDPESDQARYLPKKREFGIIQRAPSSFSDNLIHDLESLSPRASGDFKNVKSRKSKSNLIISNPLKSNLPEPLQKSVSPIKSLPKISDINFPTTQGITPGRKLSGRKISSNTQHLDGSIDDLEKELLDHFLNDHSPTSTSRSRTTSNHNRFRPEYGQHVAVNPSQNRVHLKPIHINN